MPIEAMPLLGWTVAGVRGHPGRRRSHRRDLDGCGRRRSSPQRPLTSVLAVHRGSTHDVLRRMRRRGRAARAGRVLRQTGDNPFPDPAVDGGQVRRLRTAPFDYVGIDGLPLGIAGEACPIGTRSRPPTGKSTDAAEREHVMPFVCAGRTGSRSVDALRGDRRRGGPCRYTVDPGRGPRLRPRRRGPTRPGTARQPRGAGGDRRGRTRNLATLNRDVEQRDLRSAVASAHEEGG